MTPTATDTDLAAQDATVDDTEINDTDADTGEAPDVESAPRTTWRTAFTFVVIPLAIVALGAVAGWLKWTDTASRDARVAAAESVQAARDATVAMLSYQPDTVQKDLESAQARLDGPFRESYGKLIQDVVIPGAREQKISAIANVPAASSVSATANHAVALVFVNQTSIVGTDAPTDTASTVRVTLDRVDGRWLISAFDPI